jgi:hypothetical protein
MRTKAILTAGLVLVWLAFQTTTPLAHYGPGDAAGFGHAHGGCAAAHDAGEDASSGHAGHGQVADGDQTAGDGTHTFECCSVACVGFVMIDMQLPDRAVPTGSYIQRALAQPNPVASSLATPPPNLHA